MTHPPRRPEPEWYTVLEVATELRVSKMTVYRLIHDDYLRASKFRQQFRIHRDDLTRYMRDAGAWK